MAVTGIGTTTKAIGAALIAIAFVSIAFNNITATDDLETEVHANIDSRRLAQAMEVMDQKREGQARLNFAQQYDRIDVRQDLVIFAKIGEEQGHLISLQSSVAEENITRTQSICIIKETTGIRVNGTCPVRNG